MVFVNNQLKETNISELIIVIIIEIVTSVTISVVIGEYISRHNSIIVSR